MKRIIFDSDNTMGVPGCDCDDGLALLYLLAHADECQLIGLTCAYGNSNQETVYENTCSLAAKLGLTIPVLKGGADPQEARSEAAHYLAEQAAAAPGELSILATGSLTNLKGAAQIDPQFYDNLCEVAIMGGITEELLVNGLPMDELNVSCDPEAMAGLLQAKCPLTIATAQSCLPASCSRELFLEYMGQDSWLTQLCDPWFSWMKEQYNMAETIFWDVLAAAALVTPEKLDFLEYPVASEQNSLDRGYIEKAAVLKDVQRLVKIPIITDPEVFRAACLDAWALFA